MAVPDPAEIETSAQFAAALDRLRGTRSLRALEKAAKELPARGGRTSALPPSTVSDVLNGKSLPSMDTLIALLQVCQVDEPERQAWVEARDRVEHRYQRRPTGAVRVRDARPRLLGVHAAIQTDQARQLLQRGRDESGLPPYVPRDLDADLRTMLTVAERQGGFVLLVGGSSVGKTRALFEAVRSVLANWWLLHPADPDAIRQAAAAPTERTVLWLDELQTYLNHPTGLPAASIRELITAGVIVVATLWPGEYSKRVTPPEDNQLDSHAGDRQLLGLADVVIVPTTFSAAERRRAENLAATDTRIRVALDTPDAGFTQVMAAGPELVQWWENAPDNHCYGQAVITAALDARRVGAQAPATLAYLEAAVPGYLTSKQQAEAPPNWLKDAIAYATTPLHGATSTLRPVAAGMGRTAGYTVADYLHQHALRARRTVSLPDTAWRALVHHHHPDDTHRLTDNAQRRGRDHEAETLYRELAGIGNQDAAHRLVDLLTEHGRINEALTQLRTLADNGNQDAAHRLVDLLTEHGRINEALTQLRTLADNGNQDAARRLANLLAKHGHTNELAQLADNGNPFAARRLVDQLAEHGHTNELAQLADNGNPFAARRLVDQLAEHGRINEALTRFRALADNGNQDAAHQLANLLAEHGRINEALTWFRALADNGSMFAAHRLANLLAEHGRIDEALTQLRALADNGNPLAARRLVDLLAEQGRVDELTHLAENDDQDAARRLTELLIEHGQVDELAQLADNGNPFAARRLVDELAQQGNVDEALTQLRALADNGNMFAAHQLTTLLAQHGSINELTQLANNGNPFAARRLPELLAENGRVDEALTQLRTLADNGNQDAAHQLAELLAENGRVDEALTQLRTLADNGSMFAAYQLAELLAQHGYINEALTQLRTLADNGSMFAARRLAELLAQHGRIDELEAEVAAGSWGALEALRSVRSRY